MKTKTRAMLVNRLEILRKKGELDASPAHASECKAAEQALTEFDKRVTSELKQITEEEKYNTKLEDIKKQDAQLADVPLRVYRLLVLRQQRTWLYLQLLYCQTRLEIAYKDLSEFQQTVLVTDSKYQNQLFGKMQYYAEQFQAIRKKLQLIVRQLEQRQREFDRNIPSVTGVNATLNNIIEKILLVGRSTKDPEFWGLVEKEIASRKQMVSQWLSLMDNIKQRPSIISIELVTALFTTCYRPKSLLDLAVRLFDDMGENQYAAYQNKIEGFEHEKSSIDSMIANLLQNKELSINKQATVLKQSMMVVSSVYKKWYLSVDVLLVDRLPVGSAQKSWLKTLQFSSANIYIRVQSPKALYFINYLDKEDLINIGEGKAINGKSRLDLFDEEVPSSGLSKNKPIELSPRQKVALHDLMPARMLGKIVLPLRELIDQLNNFLGLIFYKGQETIKSRGAEHDRRPSSESKDMDIEHGQETLQAFITKMYGALNRERPIQTTKLTAEDEDKLNLELINPENTDLTAVSEKHTASLVKSRTKGAIRASLGAQDIKAIIADLQAFYDSIEKEEKVLSSDLNLPASVAPGQTSNFGVELERIKKGLNDLIALLKQKEQQLDSFKKAQDDAINKSTLAMQDCKRSIKEANQAFVPQIVGKLSEILAPVTLKKEEKSKSESKFLPDVYHLTGIHDQMASAEEKFMTDVRKIKAINPTASLADQMRQFKAIIEPWVSKTAFRTPQDNENFADSLKLQRKILNSLLCQQALVWRAEAKQKDARVAGFTPQEYKAKSGEILGVPLHFFSKLIGGTGLIKTFQTEQQKINTTYKAMQDSLAVLNADLASFQAKSQLAQVSEKIKQLKLLEKEIVFFIKNQFIRLAEPVEKAHDKFISLLSPLADLKKRWEELASLGEKPIEAFIRQVEKLIQSIPLLKNIPSYKNLTTTFTASSEAPLSSRYQEINAILNPLFKWSQSTPNLKSMNEKTWTAITCLNGLMDESTVDIDTVLTVDGIMCEILQPEQKETNKQPRKSSADYPNRLIVHLFRTMNLSDRGTAVDKEHIEKFLLVTQGVQQLAISLLLQVEAGGGEKASLKSELYNLILKECAGKSIAAKRHFLMNKCSEQIFKLITVLKTRENEFVMLQKQLGMPVADSKQEEANILATLTNIGKSVGDLTCQLDKILLPQRDIDELKAEQAALPYATSRKFTTFTACVDEFFENYQIDKFDVFPVKISELDSNLTLRKLLEIPNQSFQADSVSTVEEVKEVDLGPATSRLVTVVEKEIEVCCDRLSGMVAQSEADLLGGSTSGSETKAAPVGPIVPKAVLNEIGALSYFDPENSKPERRIGVPPSLIRLANEGNLTDFMAVWFSPNLTSSTATFINAGKEAKPKGLARKHGVLGVYLLKAITRTGLAGEIIRMLVKSPCFNVLNPFKRFTREPFGEIRVPAGTAIWHTVFITLKLAGLNGEHIASAQALYNFMELPEREIKKLDPAELLEKISDKLNISIHIFTASKIDSGSSDYEKVAEAGNEQKGIALVWRENAYYPLVSTKSLMALASDEEILALFQFPPIKKASPKKNKISIFKEPEQKQKQRKKIADLELTSVGSDELGEVDEPPSSIPMMTPAPVPAPAALPLSDEKEEEVPLLDWGYDTYSPEGTEEEDNLSTLDTIILAMKGGKVDETLKNDEIINDGILELTSNPKSIREFFKFLQAVQTIEKGQLSTAKAFLNQMTDPKNNSSPLKSRPQKRTVIRILTEQFLGKPFQEDQLVEYILKQLNDVISLSNSRDSKGIARKAQAKEEAISLLLTCPIEIFIKVFIQTKNIIGSVLTDGLVTDGPVLVSRHATIALLTNALSESELTPSEKSAAMKFLMKLPSAKSAAMNFLMTLPSCSLRAKIDAQYNDFFELPKGGKVEEALQIGLNILGIEYKVSAPQTQTETKKFISQISKAAQVSIMVFSETRTGFAYLEYIVDKPTIYLYQHKLGEYHPVIPVDWLIKDQQRILTVREQVLKLQSMTSATESPLKIAAGALSRLSLAATGSSVSASSSSSSSSGTSSPARSRAGSTELTSLSITTIGSVDSSVSISSSPLSRAPGNGSSNGK